jgi:putative flippase GtrA
MKSTATSQEVKRKVKFGVVGIINTLIDFIIFNVMTGAVGFNVVPANLISTSAAMPLVST